MKTLARAAEWGRRVKRDAFALWLAARDPRVPWYAKLLAGAVAAYALSPIDLIPDFVPILGYVDDLIIVPAGIVLATRLIPDALMAEFRAAAAKRDHEGVSIVGGRRRDLGGRAGRRRLVARTRRLAGRANIIKKGPGARCARPKTYPRKSAYGWRISITAKFQRSVPRP